MILNDRGQEARDRLKIHGSRAGFRHILRFVSCILCLMLCLMFVFASACFGQAFGKNKVTSRHFGWLTYKTTHFTIHYYPDEERLVRTMADAAEIAYAKISSVLEHDLSKITPLILYKSHGDFQQTNIILEPLGEGVGGFAELLKYRIVIPFTGSINQFQKVITHEVTHIFQYDILYKELLAHIYTGEFLRSPPIWFLEGMAEYMADDWDAQGRMVLRDAVMTNSIVPLIYLQSFGPMGPRVYLGYKEGQSAVQYLAEKYGNDKLSEIMRELRDSKSKDIDSALENSIGIGIAKFDEEWQHYIKEQYWPRIADKQNPDSMGTNLTEKDRSYYNIKPVWSPSGDLMAYITNRDGYEEIRIISTKDGELFSRPIKQLHGGQYNSIREKGSGLAWSPDGDKIAFIGVRKSKDFLLIVDVVTGELANKIEMPFDSAYSATWSPDSEQIGIIGFKDGRSDVYILRLKDKQMTRLTSDAYDDSSPSWHPSEPKITYSSERNGSHKIFTLDLNTQQSQQITYGSQNDISPRYTPDGKSIVFSSDMNGIYDVFTVSADGREWTKLTNILTGCFNPTASPDGSSIATSIYHKSRYDIHILKSTELLNEKIPPPQQEAQNLLYVIDDRGVIGVKYSLGFAPDMVYVDFGYVSGGGIQNTIQFTASDIMGNHRLMAGIDSNTFRDQPEFFLAYYYLRKRIDYGSAIYNWSEFHIEGGNEFRQRTTGVAGYLTYPLDQFNRIDLRLERYSRSRDYADKDKESEKESFTLLGLSVVKDVITWSSFGPYSGMRYNFSVEHGVKLRSKDSEMTNVVMDFRKYFKLGRRSNLAFRFLGAASMGQDKQKFYLGSSFSQSQGGFYFAKTLMRGYDFNDIAGNRVGLLNFEIRIPFIDELRFGWPFTWGFQGIRGVVFMDFAGVWPRPSEAKDIYGNDIVADGQFKPWSTDDPGFRLIDLRASVGAGFRIGFGMLSLSFDFAKKTDLRDFGDGYEFHFGLGQEF